MRVEYFKRFYIRGYHGDYTALFLALEFCGAQSAQRAENFIPESCQNFESDKMVAVLLRIPQYSAHNAAAHRNTDKRVIGDCHALAQQFRHRHRARHGNAHGADIAQKSVYYGKRHDIGQTAQHHDKSRHYPAAAAAEFFLFHISPSPPSSSAFWVL